MRSRCSVARALVLAGLWLASAGVPLALSDAGPHVHYGWGESIRLRHLYTAGPHGPSSCFLRIRADGAVDCARGQSVHSECPPGLPAAQRPFPLLPSTPAGSPLPKKPGFGTSEVCALWVPRQREELGEGDMDVWTFRTHAFPSPDTTRLASAYPSLLRTPGLGTSAFRSLPETPDARGAGAVGVGGARAHAPTASACYGPRGSRLKLSASLEPGLVEIRAVALRNVAIKGVDSVRYLCMGADGRMLGLVGVTTERD